TRSPAQAQRQHGWSVRRTLERRLQLDEQERARPFLQSGSRAPVAQPIGGVRAGHLLDLPPRRHPDGYFKYPPMMNFKSHLDVERRSVTLHMPPGEDTS